MWKLLGSRTPQFSLPRRGRVLYFAMVAVGLLLIVTASRELVIGEQEYYAARSEYDELNKLFSGVSTFRYSGSINAGAEDGAGSREYDSEFDDTYSDVLSLRLQNSSQAEQLDPLASLTALNSEFVGWISIEGIIEYPVVRGQDNEYYLDRTFSRQQNASGAIFMDCRNTRGFSETVSIIYGHNMRDGSMFASLKQFLDPAFMSDNPEIAIVTSEGRVLIYQIFLARETDVSNRVYELGFSDASAAAKAFRNAPDNASNFIVLSTCTNSADKDDRMLLYAALVS